jgi:hypothetical protein
VAEVSRAERLASTHHLVVVLRLVVETGGHVLYGEVMPVAGDRGHRFVGLAGLGPAVLGSVADWVQDMKERRGNDIETAFQPHDAEHGPVG